MPHYDYSCTSCGYQAEIFHKMTESIKKCPECQNESFQKGPGGGVGLAFKGNGFYLTDYPQAGEGKTAESKGCPCGKEQGCSSS